ncbi:MAG: hypothetical protein R3270_05460 [Gammaproteobacteria bacterium]|nr:hypothetical protein [Gammaproteobacteria bacterium]
MLNRFRRITSDTWFALGLEFVAIVLGVMIALTMDEWREEREIEHNIAIAMERLNDEILLNHSRLLDALPVIEERYARLAAIQVDRERSFADLVERFGGYRVPELKDSVWRRVSGDRLANRMPAGYIEAGFRLYNHNELLDSLRLEINDLMTHQNYHDPAQASIAKGISLQIMRQQIVWAREALAVYDYFIQQHIDPEHSDE